jgi:RNA polymerase sigma factor (sigma-70 family)
MTNKSKVEITIETDRRFIVRRRRRTQALWCRGCAEVVQMASPEDVAVMTGLIAREIYRAVEAGTVHFTEPPEGLLQVCLPSLAVTLPELNDLALLVEQLPQAETNAPETQLLRLPVTEISSATRWEVVGANGATTRGKSWTLTGEAFNRLLGCLDADRDRAARKYEITRRKLIKYFECRGCRTAEDLTDDTINRVARRILEGKQIWTTDPSSYFYGVARNVVREYWSSPERGFMPLDDLPPLAHPAKDVITMKTTEHERLSLDQRLAALEASLAELPAESRDLIVRYYEGEKSARIRNRRALAEQLGIPPNALRIRMHRLREKLERRVAQHLKDVR